MMSGSRRALLVVTLLAFCALAYGPLAHAGFVGDDLPILVHASRIAWPAASRPAIDWAEWTQGGLRPLATASMALSSRLWSDAGRWDPSAAVGLRIENLLLLLLAGWMIGRTVQRALVPWYGSEVARSASWASAMIVAAHPLSVPAVASPAARGALLALAFGALSAALFMRARQDRSSARLFAALLSAALAGLSSDVAFFLPLILGVLEYASARRHRSVGARLRTAFTTVVGFGLLVSIDAWISSSLGVSRPTEGFFDRLIAPGRPGSADSALVCAVAKLGVLLLPVPSGVDSTIGYAVTGALALLAVQPALVAARSAPKLWGWILLAWTVAVGLALLSDARVCVHASELASARGLLPGAVAISAGFAVTSTALSGIRRTVLPLVVCAVYATLAHFVAEAWPKASTALEALAEDIARARTTTGRNARLFVLHPPGAIAGLEVIGDSLPLLADPAIDHGIGESGPRYPEDAQSVIGIERAALFAFAHEPEFDQLCRAGLAIMLEPSATGGDSRRDSLRLEPGEDSDSPMLWRSEGSSPPLNLDPSRHRALRVTALPNASTAEPPLMGWRSRSEVFANGEIVGVWIAGRDGPVAVFDLNRSLAWIAGKRIARIWFERSLSKLVSAEILADVPALSSVVSSPDVRGDAWDFHTPPDVELPRPLHGEARWVLGLLDLERYRHAEFDASEVSTRLSFDGASNWERVVDGSIVWTLEYRVGETALARASGRRRLAQ